MLFKIEATQAQILCTPLFYFTDMLHWVLEKNNSVVNAHIGINRDSQPKS